MGPALVSVRAINPRFLIPLALLASPAWADFTGKVVAVADGDTITVLRDHVQVKVCLVEIDAPEKKQAFGNQSKELLSEMCFGKTATLADKGKDRYRADACARDLRRDRREPGELRLLWREMAETLKE